MKITVIFEFFFRNYGKHGMYFGQKFTKKNYKLKICLLHMKLNKNNSLV